MKVIADQDKCVAAGQCVLTAPEVFDQREEDGVVTLHTDNPPDDLLDDVRQATALCPAQAIQLHQHEGS